jgi:hypothetical protein
MDCDLGRKEGWGHLDEGKDGKVLYLPNQKGEHDLLFKKMVRELNPHRYAS